ncbi:hypothetical protein STXM2123_1955 [Streptomyces sp. F-3]|uniref:SpoIIE family protein phosphatase n=1 Tax=unclassified Streptomyces TaxID=2593676 RepID=UPI0007C2BFE2|nr:MULTISPECIES: SpoIIE family protein phosphatase [unclassified Streptomyces]MDN5382685.1 SpoIIE family protein phosphatase [Streptomyces sp. LB8]GAT81255.1 hypothetical protein STXM2123_1955 [Streptomyces sp. F-3]
MAYDDADRLMDEMSASLLEALFSSAPFGLHLLDTELRVVRLNTAVPPVRGSSADELTGRPLREVLRIAEGSEVEDLLRNVLESGEALRGHVVRVRVEGDPQERYFELTAQRLLNPEGRVLGLAGAVIDVTDRERERARVGVLEAIRRRVGRTLDPSVSGEELAGAVVPEFADVAIVEVVDSVLRGDDPPLAPLPPGTPLMRTAFRSRLDDLPQAHPVGTILRLPAPTPFTQALTDLRPRVVPLHPSAPWLSVDPPRATAMRAARCHTLLVVPLALRDTVLGLVSLYRAEPSPPFDADDRRLAVELAAHTALGIDNARHYVREHTVAALVQRRLLPRRPESHTSLQAAFLTVTGADPGAWYDTIPLSGARTALVVGRVSGQGLNAATTMGRLRTVVRSLSAFDLAPDELMARLHDTAVELASERADLPLGDPLRCETLTADCVYAVHDPLTGTCVMAVAGSLTPVVGLPDRTVTVPDCPAGPSLASREDAPFATVEFEVPEGSVLVFASDPRITSSLALSSGPLRVVPDYDRRPLRELCDALVYALPDSLGTGDAAVIVARARSFSPGGFASWRLDADPSSVAIARDRARKQLTDWQVDPETAYNTELIVSELVTNALKYGVPPVELRLIRDRTLTCEVRDSGSAAPHLRHARVVDEGGRGLFIVSQLAHAWGTRFTPSGKTTWTEQPLSQR